MEHIVKRNKSLWLPRAVAFQQTNKCCSKGPVKDGIDDWIDCRGHVAQPEKRIYHMSWYRTRGTHSKENVKQEKWRPTEHEREKHQSQNLTRFLFSCNRIRGQGSLFRSSS